MAKLRRRRGPIGAVAAFALFLNLLLGGASAMPRLAPADPLAVALEASLCMPGDAGSNDTGVPGKGSGHVPDCQLCGPACVMGGCAPSAALLAVALSFLPRNPDGLTVAGPARQVAHTPALYPSDTFSQAPPAAA